MAKTSLHVTIPQPCHEDWGKMQQTACGAFCKACDKEVIDFTDKSEREIVEILSQKQGTVCGRMRSNMLNRELVKYEPDTSAFSWKKWMIAAGVLLGINSAKANHLPNEPANYSILSDTTGLTGSEKRDTVCVAPIITDTVESADKITHYYAGAIYVTPSTVENPKGTSNQKTNTSSHKLTDKFNRRKD